MTRRPIPRTAWRDTVLFVSGLALIWHEAIVYEGDERWGLLMLFAGMVGLPLTLRSDERAAHQPPRRPLPEPPVTPGPPPAPTPGPGP